MSIVKSKARGFVESLCVNEVLEQQAYKTFAAKLVFSANANDIFNFLFL